MLPGFLLSLREGLEAALIVGIVIGVLVRLDRPHLRPAVWQGVGVAVGLSLLVGLGLNWLGMELTGKAEETYEGIAMLLAAGVLTWMILWMQKQGSQVKRNLEIGATQASQTGKKSLFFLAFIAVFREGLELALFLVATSLVSGGSPTLLGAFLGLAAAFVLGWTLFIATRKMSLRGFFQVTNVLLILFAAGLVGLGVHELNEAGWIPPVIEQVWDINPILSDKSELGLVVKSLFGYNGNPSLTEVAAYLAYFFILSANFLRFRRQEIPSVLAKA